MKAMSERIWTEDQKKAISVDGRSILVSAAAGSGKTASLAERVIRKITRKDSPIDADKLLIVTFTNAAAAEMRQRISGLLADLIEKRPFDSALKRQQSLLKHTSICTIHSFCLNTIKENFYRLDISPNFRIADENEISVLAEKAIDKVLERFYDEGDKIFFKLVETFSNEKSDSGLVDVIKKIYEFVGSCPFPDIWFEETEKMYKIESKITETPWGKEIIKYSMEALDYCECLLKSALKALETDQILKGIYFDALSLDFAEIIMVKETINEKSWDEIRKRLDTFKRGRRKSIPAEYQEDTNILLINGVRDYIKKVMDKIKKYFAFSEATCKKDQKEIAEVIKVLFKVTKEFIKELSLIKNEKNIAEFNDLEHLMIKLLTERDNSGGIRRSKTAEEISLNYEEIMVDEYQDTNEAQDFIFRMISKDEKNLFMVGDVKQSIYGFRQAKPGIFINKKEKYALYSKEDSSPCKIILGKNFRSSRRIIDAVNFVFDKLMSKNAGGVTYNQEEILSCGAACEEKGEKEKSLDVVCEILELSNGSNSEKAEAKRISEIIANMIKDRRMIKDGNTKRPVTYKDFCILLRSANSYASIYAKELSIQGIPSWSDVSGKLLEASEVSAVMSLLRVIDNPIQDIPLISSLLGPAFGFTPDDLSEIRIKNRTGALYFAVKNEADSGNEKCRSFLDKIDNYRRLSSIISVEKLINYIYEDTSYSSIVLSMANGEARLANLRLFAEYAKKYDGTSYRGLSGFIEFVDKLKEKGADLSSASTISESSNVVKIMSIHRSKGLEFPICIIARCSGGFNKESGEILIHEELGLGIKLKDESGSIKYPNFIRNGVNLATEREEMSEELRVLYVAMTRAKQKLIFLISVKDIAKSTLNSLIGIFNGGKMHPYAVRNSPNFGTWILNCALLSDESQKIYKYAALKSLDIDPQKPASFEINITPPKKEAEKKTKQTENAEKTQKNTLPAEILKRFNFKYLHDEVTKSPAKISASKLAHADVWKDYIAVSRPAFMSDKSITPTEKGTAFHEFLHYADYNAALKDFDAQLKYLKTRNFLTDAQATAIDKDSVFKFLKGTLGQRIIKSNKFLREYRFTVGVQAGEENYSNNASGDDKIIIQGAIDCIFEEEDDFVIVDYKTDRVENLNTLKDRYAKQLNIYKYAFEICEEEKVKELLIYSLFIGEEIKL